MNGVEQVTTQTLFSEWVLLSEGLFGLSTAVLLLLVYFDQKAASRCEDCVIGRVRCSTSRSERNGSSAQAPAIYTGSILVAIESACLFGRTI